MTVQHLTDADLAAVRALHYKLGWDPPGCGFCDESAWPCRTVLLLDSLAQARAVLERVEWGCYHDFHNDKCPCCYQPKNIGHADDCGLAKALGRTARVTEGQG